MTPSNPTSEQMIEAIKRRAEDLKEWLRVHGRGRLITQEHLEGGSHAQMYWHYGYYVALQDVLKKLETGEPIPRTFQ